MSATNRLALALSSSGLVLGFLASARLGHPGWAAALAPVPLLVALRCLPLPLGLVLAASVGVLARVLGSLGLPLQGALAEAALGAVALLPALLADRLLVERWPRAGALAFPAVVVLTTAMARALHWSLEPLPLAEEGFLGVLDERLGWAAPLFLCAALAQGLTGLASVANGQRADPLPQVEREAAARQVAVSAGALALLAWVAARLLEQ